MKAPALLTAVLTAFALTGCHRDMYVQPYKRPLDSSPVFADQAASRLLVAHTVAQEEPESIGPAETGFDKGQLLLDLPVPITSVLLARGQERYGIYCAVCHGEDGAGNGMIVQRGFPAPPTFHSDRLREAPAGHYFDVITNGYGVMYPYASRVSPQDRWAITAYIRALQFSRHAPAGTLPSTLWDQIEKEPR